MWLVLILPAIFSVISSTWGYQVCPSTAFKQWRGRCYSFHSNDWSTNWYDARKNCQDKSTALLNVDLLVINSEEENTYVYNQMTAQSGYDYWIGYSREPGAGLHDFDWVDGTPKGYENWGEGEPNNSGNNEDCTEVRTNPKATWNDIYCTFTSNSHVCEGPSFDGWVEYNGKEYYINSGSDNPNWYEARAYCNENGGELASISSEEEAKQIYEWLEQMTFTASVWTGLNKLDGDQTQWMWSDYSSIAGYTNWKYGHPSHSPKYLELCGAVRSNDPDVEWYEDHCDEANHGFVCKRLKGDTGIKTPKPPVTGGGFCPAGYTAAGDKCFSVHFRDSHNGHTWQGAVDYCRQRTGFLSDIASINNPLEQAVVTSMLQKTSLPLWIGLYRLEAGTKEWLWSDNSPWDFINWGPGDPILTRALCADVRPYGFIGSWGNRDCDETQGFICQILKDPNYWISTPAITTPNICQAEYIPYATGCYKYYSDLKTWDAAKSICSGDKANLVSIHTGAENGFVQSLAWDNQMPVWTGLRDTAAFQSNHGPNFATNYDYLDVKLDREKSGEYTWSDNWAVTYTRWGADEPSQDPNNGGCVILRQVDGTWADTYCSSLLAFVCKTTDAPRITTPEHKDGRCPGRTGWKEDGGFCYKFTRTSSGNWVTALARCKAESILANLVSIHSVHENTWVYKQLTLDGTLTSHTWIGLYRRTDTNGFGWNDLTPLQFERWAPGEPNGDATGQNCVAFHKDYPGYWQDQLCSTYQGYICKAPKVTYPTMPPTVNGTCPLGWVAGSYHCYLFKPNLHVRWIEARQYCKDNGDGAGNADLIIIQDAAEDIFVNTEMFIREDSPDKNEEFWIGLAKKKAHAPYLWVDGTAPEKYKNWEEGEPNSDDEGDENCVMQYVDNTKWADTDCGDYKGFACKIAKAAPIIPPTKGGTNNGGPDGGAVAGIVIGCLLGAALIALVVIIFIKKDINPVNKVREVASGFINPSYAETKKEGSLETNA